MPKIVQASFEKKSPIDEKTYAIILERVSSPDTPKESPLFQFLSFFGIIFLVFAFKSSILDANNIPSGSMIPTLKIGDFLFVNKMRYSLRLPFAETEFWRIDNPKRGDIVTFIPPQDALMDGNARLGIFAKRFVKRVVGLPGDTIRITRKFVTTDRGKILYSEITYKPQGSTEFLSYDPREIPIGEELSDLDNLDASRRGLFLENKPGFEHFVLEGKEDDRRSHFYEFCDFATGCEIPEGHYMVMGDNRDDSHDSRAWGWVPREDILGKALVLYFSIDWKDFTCEYRDGQELAELGPEKASRYSGKALESRCLPFEITSQNGRYREEEVTMNWFNRTFGYRIWRAQIRWDRIGRILQ